MDQRRSEGSLLARLLRPFSRSLRAKIIAAVFVPTALILIAVALVNFYAYQEVTEELVIERDQDLTRLSAGQLATELAQYTNALADLGRSIDASADPPALQRMLDRATPQLVVFDGGVFILDHFGTVVAGSRSTHLVGRDWSNQDYFRQVVRSPKPLFSNVIPSPSIQRDAVALAVPVTGDQGQFLGAVVGVFNLEPSAFSAFYGGIVKLRIAEEGRTYLVDGNGHVIYHPDSARIGADYSAQQVVGLLSNGRSGAFRTKDIDGTDIVAGFSPIPGTPWGLVTEESWSALTSEGRDFQRYLLLLLALGVAVPALIVAFGSRRIMRPIDGLIAAARQVAQGNFSQTIVPASSDEVGELATEFNSMASQLKASYEQLEQRVADRTMELAQSEERLRTVVTGAPVILFALDRNGIFTVSECTGLAALGLLPGSLVGQSVYDAFREVPEMGERYQRSLAGEEFTNSVDVRGITFETHYSPLRNSDGHITGVIGIATDITERRRAEDAGRYSEERYRALFEQSRDPIFISSEGIVIDANSAALELFGITREEAVGSDVGDRYADPADRGRFRDAIDERGFVRDFELRLLKKDGTEMDCLLTAIRRQTVEGDDDPTGDIQGLVRDVTARKRAEQELLQQTREMAVLEKRNRMAREIHDTMAQGFTGVVLQLEAAEEVIGNNAGSAAEHLDRAKSLARECLQEARRSVWNLLPHSLEDQSLEAALKKEVDNFSSNTQARATFTPSGQTRTLSPEIQTALLRICQESLTNVGKHASASEVAVGLSYQPQQVSLTVRDNGRGFIRIKSKPPGVSSGFGLSGMEQRARGLNGVLAVKSNPGAGTLVEVNIPVA